MSVNVEIKARLSNLEATRSRVHALASLHREEHAQTDTFFLTAHGRLKVRKFGSTSGELIFYEREDRLGPKTSTYQRLPCECPDALTAVLTAALGVRGIVSKWREVFIVGQTRIHLDSVSGLGHFIELEVAVEDGQEPEEAQSIALDLLSRLDVPPTAFVAAAYIDLLI